MKKLLSLLLSTMLVASLVPGPALAEVVDEFEVVVQEGNGSEVDSEGIDTQEDRVPDEVETVEDAVNGATLSVMNAGADMGIWLKDLSTNQVDDTALHPMHPYEILTNKDDWSNTGNILFSPYKNDGTPILDDGPYSVIVNADKTSLDGLFYKDTESGLALPLPEGYYTITFTGEAGSFTTAVGEYSSESNQCAGLYRVDSGKTFAFRDYYGMSEGSFASDGLSIASSETHDTYGDETIPLGSKLDLDLGVATATPMTESTTVGSCYLYMYKALDSEHQNYSLANLREQYTAHATSEWPGISWWNSNHDYTGVKWTVWEYESASSDSNDAVWSLTPSNENGKTGVLSIRDIDLSESASTNPALEPGVYFPVIQMEVGQHTYYYAYNPIEVAFTNTDTLGEDAGQTDEDLTVVVQDSVTLGSISYSPTVIWTLENAFDEVGTDQNLHLSVPVSQNLHDPAVNLQGSRVYYRVAQTSVAGDSSPYWGDDVEALSVLSEDGTTFEIDVPMIQANTLTIDEVEVSLYLRDNQGNPIMDGPTGEGDLMKVTAIDSSPAVSIGSWVSFEVPEFEGEPPTDEVRVRMWPIDENNQPTGEEQVAKASTWSLYETLFLKAAPGRYAFVMEGAAPVLDDDGNPVLDDENEPICTWVDLMGSSEAATEIEGTSPRQFTFTVPPRQTVEIDIEPSVSSYDFHTATCLFEDEEPDTYKELYDGYEVRWYRYIPSRVGDEFVLVGTGRTVSLERSSNMLYVEVVPTGRNTSFWKSSEKQLVTSAARDVEVKVPRKKLFNATLHLTNPEGREPASGKNWGIIEVKTPLESYGYTSYNTWATSNEVTVSNVTAGSIITYTPPIELLGGSVSYTVPSDAESAIEVTMAAPLPKGLVTFDDLSFVRAKEETQGEDASQEDEGDVAARTVPFALDDGQTTIAVCTGTEWYDDNVPFYIADGKRIVIQDESHEATYFKPGGQYLVTIRHYDNVSTQTIGLGGNDNVAFQQFTVTLDENCQATVGAKQIVSPGSLVVPLENPDGIGCELLLYDNDGKLVDAGVAGAREQVSTPLLQAGAYQLCAVDLSVLGEGLARTRFPRYDDLVAVLDQITAKEKQALVDAGIEDEEPQPHMTLMPLEIVDGTRRTLIDRLTFPRASSGAMINRRESSVTVASNYSGYLSIQMHAELLQDVQLTDDAYLVVDTNQPSGETGAGWTNPKALNINGRAVAISRWGDLFGGTQNMDNGSLRVMLAEAAKTSEDCRSFPMDMTLIIPRNSTATSTEVRVWLVSDEGTRRDLVGSCDESIESISITAPPMVAWDTFSVYGETRPRADVAVYVNGMRAADTRADEYGFYTTEITLPMSVEEWDEFTVSASAQWTKNGFDFGATTAAQTVTYTTEFPVIEQATMFYQHDAGEDYIPVESYYRGAIPAKYLTFYRAAQGDRDKDAKYFWMVEFANGQDAKDVYINVPRSETTLKIPTTDSLTTAKGWIADLADSSQSSAGKLIRDALTSDTLRSFVCEPRYLNYCPSTTSASFDVEITRKGAPYSTKAPARYKGLKGANADSLATFLQQMNGRGLRAYANASDVNLAVAYDASEQATKLAAAGATTGDIDQWLLLSDGEDGADETFLTVRHQTSVTDDMDVQAIRNEVQGIRNGADAVVEKYEEWLLTNKTYENSGVPDYKGKFVVLAMGTNYTFTTSDDYVIITENRDAQGDTQVEEMNTYLVEGSESKKVYQYLRADKKTMTSITWNEDTGQRLEVTYTIPDDALATTGWDEAYGMSLVDVGMQWTTVQAAVRGGYGQSCDLWWNDPVFAVESVEDGESALGVQGGPTGAAKGHAQDYVIGKARKGMGIKSDEQLGQQLDYLDGLKDDYKQPGANKVNHTANAIRDGNRTAELGGAFQFIKDFLEGKAFDGAVTVATTDVGGYADPWSYVPWDVVDSTWRPLRNDIRRWWNKKWKNMRYNNYRIERMKEIKGHPNIMNLLRSVLPKDELDDFEYRFRYDLAEYDAVHWPNGKVTHDPSGMIYEAVLSNPVEGATVTLFTYNSVGDVAQFFDSQKHNVEENPQVTGADGRYQWFVPEGFWQVRVEKNGYKSVSTGDSAAYGIDATKDLDGDGSDDASQYWMPVLPVQLDVNIGLVSMAAPTVTSIQADEKGAVVTFSKYMRVDTVTARLFLVDGKAPASVEATDTEAAGDGSGVMLARTFRLAYAGGNRLPGAACEVKVADANGDLKSYANVSLAQSDRSKRESVRVADTGTFQRIAQPQATNRTYNGKEQVGVPAGKGYTLTGTASATNAGSYSVTAKLAIGCMWADGTTADKKLAWSIYKAAGSVEASATTVEVLLKKAKKKASKVKPITATAGATFSKVSGAKELAVDAKTGQVTLKKGVKKAKSFKAVVRVTAPGDANHNAASTDVNVVVKVVKKLTNPMKVTTSAKRVKASKAKGKVTYKKTKGPKGITVNAKNGKIKIKKGTKKGTYTIKVKVTAAGNKDYKKATKTVSCKVTVK